MSGETKQHIRDAWLPILLVAIGALGLLIQGGIFALDRLITAVTAALN
jgi:hypothetical protein